jgi:hypothetical protein
MTAPLIPQEIFLLERYSSPEYFRELRDAFKAMVTAAEDALAEFMTQLPPDYRSQPLYLQPDAVWGERVIPNLQWTLKGLEEGYNRLLAGDHDALGQAGNVGTAFTAINRDYTIEWMAKRYQDEYDRQESIASERASNISITSLAQWAEGDLTTNYKDSDRGVLNAPTSFPVYALNTAVQIRTDKKVPRSGIYLPSANRSCAAFLIEGYEAWGAKIRFKPDDLTSKETRTPSTWTLVERVADSGGGSPGDTWDTNAPSADVYQQSIPGGEACPRTGWWFTAAKAHSRRYFKAGDAMPTIEGSDYGHTFWQWDTNQENPSLR